MSWWGGGGSKKEDPSEKGFSDGSPDFADTGPNLMQSSSSSTAGGGMAEFQQFSLSLQQQVLVQQVITELTHTAFKKCCTASSTRDSQLTGKEVACIHAATNKWLDANEFLMGRLAKKQQQQQNAAAGQSFH